MEISDKKLEYNYLLGRGTYPPTRLKLTIVNTQLLVIVTKY